MSHTGRPGGNGVPFGGVEWEDQTGLDPPVIDSVKITITQSDGEPMIQQTKIPNDGRVTWTAGELGDPEFVIDVVLEPHADPESGFEAQPVTKSVPNPETHLLASACAAKSMPPAGLSIPAAWTLEPMVSERPPG